jgi:hypothetical protein
MQTASSKKSKKSSNGFTQIPNAIIFDPTLSLSEFRTYAAILSYAFGKKTEAKPSQVGLSKRTGMDRETIRIALKSLVAYGLIEPLGKGKDGQRVYKVRGLNPKPKGDGRSATIGDGNPATKMTENPAQIIQQKNTSHEYAAPRLAGSSLSDAKEASGESLEGSAASPESAVPSEIEVNTEPGSHGNGNAAEPATPPGHNGRNTLLSRDDDAQDAEDVFAFGPRSESEPSSESAPPRDVADETLDELFGTGSDPTPQKSAERPYSKPTIAAELQERRIAPDGVSFHGNVEDGAAWLEAVKAIKRVGGQSFNHGALQDSIDEHGEACVWFHAKWFLLRLAASKKPPDKPVPFFLDCVAQDYAVNPKWRDLIFSRVKHGCFTDEQRKELPANDAPPVEWVRWMNSLDGGLLDDLPDTARIGIREAIKRKDLDVICALAELDSSDGPISDEGPVDELADAEVEAEAEELPF